MDPLPWKTHARPLSLNHIHSNSCLLSLSLTLYGVSFPPEQRKKKETAREWTSRADVPYQKQTGSKEREEKNTTTGNGRREGNGDSLPHRASYIAWPPFFFFSLSLSLWSRSLMTMTGMHASMSPWSPAGEREAGRLFCLVIVVAVCPSEFIPLYHSHSSLPSLLPSKALPFPSVTGHAHTYKHTQIEKRRK